MIPYSMAYTDVYTKHLSELTGGTSAGAARYQQQAIDAANEEFSTSADLQDDNQKVQSAMDALAAASEHTGAANALQQISIQFAGALTSTASTGDAQGGDAAADRVRYGWAGSDTTSMAAKAERKRLAAVSKQEREEAERKAQALASGKTDDDSQSGMSIGDVMGNASGLGMLGDASRATARMATPAAVAHLRRRARHPVRSRVGSEVLAGIRHRRHEPQIAVAEHVV